VSHEAIPADPFSKGDVMNLPMWKKLLVALIAVGGAASLTGAPALLAQKADTKAAVPEKAKSYKRLPAFYADIVDGSQKEKIYALQEKWGKQIDALAEQIKDLQKQRDAEIEGVLTPEQKTKLEKSRAEAKAKAQERTAAAKKGAEDKAKQASTTSTQPAK
jgi:hypothetical protein